MPHKNRSPLKNLLKTQIYRTWGAFSQTFREPYEYILILASARSGSTLLVHILSSNPEICGMGESKISVTSPAGYNLIAGKNMYIHWRSKMPRTGDERYILDKLVHNHLLDPQDIALLKNPRVRIVFLLREPIGTITSQAVEKVIQTVITPESRWRDYQS